MLPALYHAHHTRSSEDMPFWLNLARQTGDTVLELGCGTGRVLVPVAEAGLRAIGLDHDISMLNFLVKNLDAQVQPMPSLVCADLTRFNLAAKYPLIILPCNTFSTLDETSRIACLECVHRHLRRKGIFAISLANPSVLQAIPARSKVQIEDEFYHPQTGNPVQVSSSWKRARNKLRLTWVYDHLFPDGSIQRLTVEATHHLTSVETYLAEIENADLAVNAIYGDYDYSEYRLDSPYLIILASPSPH